MQSLNFIFESILVKNTSTMGRGIFTRSDLKKGTLVETAPVIVMDKKDRYFLDQSLLHDYIFEWGPQSEGCCMALGYISLYNHSYLSNCEYEMNFKDETITIRTVKKISAGEELLINYNGDWNSQKKVWFDAGK